MHTDTHTHQNKVFRIESFRDSWLEGKRKVFTLYLEIYFKYLIIVEELYILSLILKKIHNLLII